MLYYGIMFYVCGTPVQKNRYDPKLPGKNPVRSSVPVPSSTYKPMTECILKPWSFALKLALPTKVNLLCRLLFGSSSSPV